MAGELSIFKQKVSIDQAVPGTSNAVVEASASAIKTAIEAVNTALQSSGITQAQLTNMVTALQVIDNFISGSRGLVTEDNSTSIKTAVELIDNFISGARGLVTEDNSGSIKTAVEAINTALQATGISQIQFAAMVTALQLIDNAVSGNALVGYRATATLLNSGVLAADASIKGSAGAIYWLSVSDSAALNIELNDSTDNGGTDVWAAVLPASCYAHYIFDPPIECGTGIYLDVSTATCKVVVGYK